MKYILSTSRQFVVPEFVVDIILLSLVVFSKLVASLGPSLDPLGAKEGRDTFFCDFRGALGAPKVGTAA